jgi:hypothetical protein
MLDGLGPAAPYRWVDPPPALAAGNAGPASARIDLALGPDGTEAAVLLSADGQITIVLAEGAFPPREGDRSVRLEATPMAPSEVGGDLHPLAFFGNAVRLEATYEPSGEETTRAELPLQVILTYPVTPSLHASTHELALTRDGRAWRTLGSTESPQLQQVAAETRALGYVAVVGEPSPPPVTVSPAPRRGGDATAVAWAVAGLAAGAFVAGVVLIVRGGRGRG